MNRKSNHAKSRKSVGRADPRTAKRVPAARRRRRRRKQSSLLPAVLFTLGVLAIIVVAIRLLPKPAANVPAATEVQTRAQGDVQTAEIRKADVEPNITLAQGGRPAGLRIGANFRRLDEKNLAMIARAGFYEVGLNDRWFNETDVMKLKEMGVKVFSNLGDYPEWWRTLQSVGVAGFKTNYAEAYTDWYAYGKK